MHELFGVEFVMVFSTTRRSLRSTPRSVRARRSVRRDLNSFVIEGATQSGQVSCHGLDDRADRGGSRAKRSRKRTHYSK
jgi:hypothetical protein